MSSGPARSLLPEGASFARPSGAQLVLVALLALAMACAFASFAGVGEACAADYVAGSLTYRVENHGGQDEAVITGLAPGFNGSMITIPEQVQHEDAQLYVTGIQYGAFRGAGSLYSVVFDAARLTSVPAECFSGCTNLQEAVLCESIRAVGDSAFSGCTSLRRLVFSGSANLEEVGNYAFQGCVLLVDFPVLNTVVSWGKGIFSDCKSLERISIPMGLASIPDEAFAGCESLVEVTVNPGIKVVGASAFEGCSSLADLILPASVTEIGARAFYGAGLASILLSSSLTTIGPSAFARCVSLKYLGEIPSSLSAIGAYAFAESGLVRIVLPEAVTELPEGAFSSCADLSSIALPASLASIGEGALSQCSSLEFLRVPRSVLSVGDRAFGGLSGARMVYFENGDLTWSSRAFSNSADGDSDCTGLTIVCAAGSFNGQAAVEADKVNATFKTSDAGSCTISFAANGGSGSMDDVVLPDKMSYTLPLCPYERANADFAFWRAPDGRAYQPGEVLTWPAASSITLTAVWNEWTEESYDVTFDANGGGGSMPAITVKRGLRVVLPVCGFTAPQGNTFQAWSYVMDGQEYSVPEGSAIYPLDEGEISVKAVWAGQHVVTFDANGGSVAPGSMLTNGAGRLDAWPEASREGYVLIGWSTTGEYGDIVALGNRYAQEATLHAVWEKYPLDDSGADPGDDPSTDPPSTDPSDPGGNSGGSEGTGSEGSGGQGGSEGSGSGGSGSGGNAGQGGSSTGGTSGGSSDPAPSPSAEDLSAYEGVAVARGFVDLDPQSWYLGGNGSMGGFFPGSSTLYLDYALGKGLMAGVDAQRFDPEGTVTRAMAATVLFRHANPGVEDGADADATGLVDVESGAWYTRAVNWCYENDVVTGYADAEGNPTGFGPDNPVTREEMAVMIARYCVEKNGWSYAEGDMSAFPDGQSVSPWALRGVVFCNENLIMTGNGESAPFNPSGPTSRVQLAKIIAVTVHMLS